MKTRCPWPKSELDIAYHDEEWGRPQRDENVLFEFLILEGAQAGLSWSTILNKRENYRRALDGFASEKIARYKEKKTAELLADPGIVRNRLKIAATITNAQAHQKMLARGESLSELLWSFVDDVPLDGKRRAPSEVPARTPTSDAMSKALAERGFKFVGSTICYALMQACGLVNDHLLSCPCHGACLAKPRAKRTR